MTKFTLCALLLCACGGEVSYPDTTVNPEPSPVPEVVADAGTTPEPVPSVGDPCDCDGKPGTVQQLAGRMCLVEYPDRVACELAR